MKKIILFSLFLLFGLGFSQLLPLQLGASYASISKVIHVLMFICLSYIMVNVGREFDLDKTKWRSYISDYFIAMFAATVPWIFVSIYFMYLLPSSYLTNFDAWKENLLLSRFAAPTSAGILFTMLAAAGLRKYWIYQKTQILAIFDDLDTVLLMIPLQIMMIGLKWQLFVVLAIVLILLIIGWTKLNAFHWPQGWVAVLGYSAIIVGFCEALYQVSKHYMGDDGAIHIEVLLPAFILGMVIKNLHVVDKRAVSADNTISYLFMFLVGLSTPVFIGIDPSATVASSSTITASQPMMDWNTLVYHIIMVTVVSNLGKMVPLFFYHDRTIKERLALSIGMFTRGEVGAGIIVIGLNYHLGGPIMIIAILSLVLNLVLTGFFILIVKMLASRTYGVIE